MKIIGLARYALGVCASTVFLAACSSDSGVGPLASSSILRSSIASPISHGRHRVATRA